LGEARDQATDPPQLPQPPDASAVNAAWPAEPPAARGLRSALERLALRVLGPRFAAQREFNARQVRLDNAVLEYLQQRLAATHRHYDSLAGELGRRLDEADERHRTLEGELVRHVQDLVRRVDLVLLESNRDRQALLHALEEARTRLARLEAAPRREE
jgi:hypothetical protein